MNRFLLTLSVLLLMSVNGAHVYAAGEIPPEEEEGTQQELTLEDDAEEAEAKTDDAQDEKAVAEKAGTEDTDKEEAEATDAEETEIKEEAKKDAVVPDTRPASFMPPPVDILSDKDEEAEGPSSVKDKQMEESVSPAPSAEKAEPVENLPKVEIAVPVVQQSLGGVDPETIGLLTKENGGFAPSLWQGLSRGFLEQTLPALALPSASPTLNDLMRRILLTSAAVPEKKEEKKGQSLLSMRIEKLLNLGLAAEAWTLVQKADRSLIDSITLRRTVKAALISPLREDVCAAIPSYINGEKGKADKASIEWEKSLLVCHALKNDLQAVQLGIDVLREQGVKDDAFLLLLTRNYLAASKVLPRRLTPLNPLTLSVLAQLNMPLPSEVYGHPEASLVPRALETKAKKENLRLKLAEKEAARGIISAVTLSKAYKSFDVAASDSRKGPLQRSQYYQKAASQVDPLKKVATVLALASDYPSSALTGSAGIMLVSLLTDVSPTSDYNPSAADVAKLMALAGQTQSAVSWYQLAREASTASPKLASALQKNWPVYALARLVPENEVQSTGEKWLRTYLKEGGADKRERKEKAEKILLLLSAADLDLPNNAWDKVFEPLPARRDLVSSPVLVERMHRAAREGRQGEVALLAGLICPEGVENTDFTSLLSIIRALRDAGLKAESLAFARETLAFLTGQ